VLWQWIPRWKAAGKTTYLEVSLRLLHMLYGGDAAGSLSEEELELYRKNRVVRLSEGAGCVATDDVCEMLNDWLKEMASSNNIEHWANKSVHTAVMRAAAKHMDQKYHKRSTATASVSPKSQRTRQAVCDLFRVAQIWTQSERDINCRFFWDLLPQVKLQLLPSTGGSTVELSPQQRRLANMFSRVVKQEAVDYNSDDDNDGSDEDGGGDNSKTVSAEDVFRMKRYRMKRDALDGIDAKGQKQLEEKYLPTRAAKEEIKRRRDGHRDEASEWFEGQQEAQVAQLGSLEDMDTSGVDGEEKGAEEPEWKKLHVAHTSEHQ